MKRREEDQLIHLAFGELAAEDAARVEANLKPQAARALDDYRALKSDLRLLNAVPEPQIGVERIREAILRHGLKRDRSFARWGLILTPCLVAACALFLITARPSLQQVDSKSSSVASNDPDFSSNAPQTPALFPDTEMTNASKAIHEDYVFAKPEKSASPVHEAAFVVHRRAHRPSIAQVSANWEAVVTSTDTPAGTSPADSGQGSGSTTPTETTPQVATDDSGQSAQGDQKIIVVHNAQDGATGAQTATEVDPSANVVFGG